MKKLVVFFVALLSIIFFSFFAQSIGVAPGSVDINHVPGESFVGSFDFTFLDVHPETRLRLTREGDLAQYIELSTDELIGGGKVTVDVNLPSFIEQPGQNRIYVRARQAPLEGAASGFGIGIVGSIKAVIKVNVPFPGKYADVEFRVEDANTGEDIPYRLKVYSRGKEAIDVSVLISIQDSNNRTVDTVSVGDFNILPSDSIEISHKLDSGRLRAGNYKAVAAVSFSGQTVTKEDSFRLGELRVRIVNFTRKLERDSINPFEIVVESEWNDPIEDLFGEVIVVGKDFSFRTPSIELKPWERSKLQGFFDTSGFEDDEVLEVKIILHYGEKITEETAILSFEKGRVPFVFVGSIIAGVLGVIIFIVWIVLKLKRLERRGSGRKK